MSTKAFTDAFELIKVRPLPDDILRQLAILERQIDIDEVEGFSWIYENLNLIMNDSSKEQAMMTSNSAKLINIDVQNMMNKGDRSNG